MTTITRGQTTTTRSQAVEPTETLWDVWGEALWSCAARAHDPSATAHLVRMAQAYAARAHWHRWITRVTPASVRGDVHALAYAHESEVAP